MKRSTFSLIVLLALFGLAVLVSSCSGADNKPSVIPAKVYHFSMLSKDSTRSNAYVRAKDKYDAMRIVFDKHGLGKDGLLQSYSIDTITVWVR